MDNEENYFSLSLIKNNLKNFYIDRNYKIFVHDLYGNPPTYRFREISCSGEFRLGAEYYNMELIKNLLKDCDEWKEFLNREDFSTRSANSESTEHFYILKIVDGVPIFFQDFVNKSQTEAREKCESLAKENMNVRFTVVKVIGSCEMNIQWKVGE